jgi:hypothetical protein
VNLGACAAFAATAIVAGASARAYACASCGCGDQTLTILGNEKPVAQRVRAGVDLLLQGETSGTPAHDELALSEQRTDLNAAWAPGERLFLLVTLPLLRRNVEYASLERKQVLGVGDLELRARIVAWKDRGFSPRHLASLIAGVNVPVTPATLDAAGAPLPPELQAGTGTFAPVVGLAYAHFHYPWSEYASAQALLPVGSRAGSRPSRSLRLTSALQRHLGDAVAARLAVDARLDGTAEESGAPDPDTGGAVVFLSPELLVSPLTDLVLFGAVRVPIAQRFWGAHTTSRIWMVGVVRDF